MTPEQAKELLPIITAFSEGITVQFRTCPSDTWIDAEELHFLYVPEHYRIKPKTIKYRFYILCFGEKGLICGIVAKENESLAQQEEKVEAFAGFLQWIDKDWVEVECPI